MAINKQNNDELKRLDHARVHPSLCLADGLFRPMKREKLDKALNIKYKYNDYTFWWRGYSLLSITDQSVFLALLRIGADSCNRVAANKNTTEGVLAEVRKALELDYEAVDNPCFVLTTSLYELAQTLGLAKSGENYKTIRDSLNRLSGVQFLICRGDKVDSPFWQANLFSRFAGADGKLFIGINPLVSTALVRGTSTFIDMAEQRQLKSEVAKKLHVWLTSWLRPKELRSIGLDVLIPHVWGDSCEGNTLRSRRASLRTAIVEINNLNNWQCVEDENRIISVKRKSVIYRV